MSTERREEIHPNLPPKKRHYQNNVTSSNANASQPSTQTYKLTNMNNKQDIRSDGAPRQLLLIDQKATRAHEQTMVAVTTAGGTNQPVTGGKVQHVVYTHTGNFAHGVQYHAPNGFIQAPMNIAPMNLPQGAQAYQTVMSSDGPVQVNAPLLLKQPVKQQFVPRSQLVQSGQKVHTLPVGAHSNGTKRNGSHLQLSAIQLKPNAQPVQAPVYRKITTQQFSRPDVADHIQDRQAVFHTKRYAGSKPIDETYEEKEIKVEHYDQQDDSMHDLSYSSFDSGDMPHFEKGSLIKLENGDCKKVEELSRDDFEKCSSYCPDKRLTKAVLVEITSTTDDTLINLTFVVENNPDNKVTVETSKDYPFWSTKLGWSSIDPQLTQQKYRLDCKHLKLHDEILSLEKNNNMSKKTDHPPTTGTHPETGPIRPIQTNIGSGSSGSIGSGSSAFRPIQTNPTSTTSDQPGGCATQSQQKTNQNLANFNSINEKRLMSERSTLPTSPSKRARRRSFSDSEFFEKKRQKGE